MLFGAPRGENAVITMPFYLQCSRSFSCRYNGCTSTCIKIVHQTLSLGHSNLIMPQVQRKDDNEHKKQRTGELFVHTVKLGSQKILEAMAREGIERMGTWFTAGGIRTTGRSSSSFLMDQLLTVMDLVNPASTRLSISCHSRWP